METRSYRFFPATTLILFSTVCEDFLEKEHRLSPSDKEALSSFDGLNNATCCSLSETDHTGLVNNNIIFTQGGPAVVNYLWAMPIPQVEINAKVNCRQNPGY